MFAGIVNEEESLLSIRIREKIVRLQGLEFFLPYVLYQELFFTSFS